MICKAIIEATRPCDCCGNNNLKRAAVLMSESGDIVEYGLQCAAKAVCGSSSKPAYSKAVKLLEESASEYRKQRRQELMETECRLLPGLQVYAPKSIDVAKLMKHLIANGAYQASKRRTAIVRLREAILPETADYYVWPRN